MLLLFPAAILSFSILAIAVLFFFPHAPGSFAGLLMLLTGHGLLSFKRPRAGLFLFCFFLPLFNSVLFSRHLNYFSPAVLLFLVFFLGWACRRIVQEDGIRITTPLNIPLLAFTALGFGSAAVTMLRYAQFYPFARASFPLATINRLDENSLQAVMQVFLVLTVFLAGPALFWTVLNLLRDRRDTIRALAAVAAGIALSALFGIYQNLAHEPLGNPSHYVELGRINATFVDPNGLGIFLGMALPPIAALVFFTRRAWARGAGLLLLLAALYVLFLSGSRTGILLLPSAAAAIAGAFVLRGRRNTPRGIAFYLQPALVVFVVLVAIWPAGRRASYSKGTVLSERLVHSFERARAGGIWSVIRRDRLEMWQRALLVTSRHPICGIGLGAYWFETPNILRWSPNEPVLRDNANSYFFQTSAEMGGIGLLLALILLGLIVRESLRLALHPKLDPPGRALAAALCGVLCGFVLLLFTGPHTEFMEIQGLFWLLTGIVFSWSLRLQSETQPGGRVLKALSPKLYSVACAGLVVVALSGQLVNALGVLSLPERREAYGLSPSEGFYGWETNAEGALSRWTTGDARTQVARAGPILEFWLYVGHPDAAQRPVTVEIMLDGKAIRKERFDQPGQTRRIRLDIPETDREKIEIRLRVNRTWRPARALPDSTDRRALGVMISEFRFVRENNP